MRNHLKFIFAGSLLVWTLGATAQNPLLANCTRSANLLACVDIQGNAYSVATAGNTIYLRGFEADSRRYWAQTNSRYGQLTFLPAWPRTEKVGLATVGAWAGQPSIAFRARAVAPAHLHAVA